jgi:hypothetical protein
MRHNRRWSDPQPEEVFRRRTWRALLILTAAFWITLIHWLLP